MTHKEKEAVALLETQIRELQERVTRGHDYAADAMKKERIARAEIEETRKQFADLKERLHNAELLNAALQGYIDRVVEDDIVREPLITVGNEDEQRLVPKRKHKPPRRLDDLRQQDYIDMAMAPDDRRHKRKHWTSY